MESADNQTLVIPCRADDCKWHDEEGECCGRAGHFKDHSIYIEDSGHCGYYFPPAQFTLGDIEHFLYQEKWSKQRVKNVMDVLDKYEY